MFHVLVIVSHISCSIPEAIRALLDKTVTDISQRQLCSRQHNGDQSEITEILFSSYLSVSFAVLVLSLINVSVGQNSFPDSVPLPGFVSVPGVFLQFDADVNTRTSLRVL